MPGYPGDTSPYAARAGIRTASAGDPVLAWDAHGRLFAGAESSDDPAGTKKTFGDVWVATYENPGGASGATTNDGKEFKRSVIVAKGSSAPNLLGKFNDKTSIEADRTRGACDGNVYFAWSRFTGNGGVNIYFGRSTDHGATFSQPTKLSASIHDVQFPDIAITGNGHVYVTFREIEPARPGHGRDQLRQDHRLREDVRPRQRVTTFLRYDAQDISDPEAMPPTSHRDDPPAEERGRRTPAKPRDCGDFDAPACRATRSSGATRRSRSTADQTDATTNGSTLSTTRSSPAPQVATGTTAMARSSPGPAASRASTSCGLNGATGAHDASGADRRRNRPGTSCSRTSRRTAACSTRCGGTAATTPATRRTRPVGNCANRHDVPSLDVFARDVDQRRHDVDAVDAHHGRDEQPQLRAIRRAHRCRSRATTCGSARVGDYAFGVWTDWRNTVAGVDQRETAADDNDAADVHQCRTFDTAARHGPAIRARATAGSIRTSTAT